MKNSFYFQKIFLLFFLIFYPTFILGDEFKFNAFEIKTSENGNLLKGSGGVKIEDNLGTVINSEKFEFDKIKSILKVKENVVVEDILNKNLLKSNDVIYYKMTNKLISKNKTSIQLNSGHVIESSDILYDRNLDKISSNRQTTIIDLNNNKFNMGSFNYSISDKILMANDIKIIDMDNNTYDVKNASFNMKTNEILGKDLSLNFNNTNFGSNENEPRLKGNSFSLNNNITLVNSGIFTTCKKNDNCPPWLLKSKKIQHNKKNKTINYTNAVLKIYNVPVLYFPKFFHPDPTVKRQSGFLTPNFSQSNNLGNYVSTPYFFALSDSTDLTLSPRIYDNGSMLYQGEYRNYKKRSKHVADFSIKSKNAYSFNEKNNSSPSHFFLKSEVDLETNNFDQGKVDLKIQQTSDDDYLKIYKIKSPLIDSENILHSSINLNLTREDLDIKVTAETYEDLGRLKSERYEYIYPSLDISKNIKDYDNGRLSLDILGSNKLFNTNVYERTLINDLKFKSFNKINALGLVSNYEILLKNFNADSERSTTYKNKSESSLQSIINYITKYPLQKKGKKFFSTLTPTISARYSPNVSKNKSKEDREINFDNIFLINRIGSSDTIEGGQSITIGNEYALFDTENKDKKIISIDIATAFRDEKDDKLPINSSLGNKQSDIFGNMNFNLNTFIDFDYNFALDNDLETLNYNKIKSTLSFSKFVSTFEFLEKNSVIGSNSYLSNESKLFINNSSSLSFKTRKNKEKDLTEYYNLIYQYRNDCLIAGLEYQKDFYSDGSLKPEEQLFFSVTIMPFGKANSPDMK